MLGSGCPIAGIVGLPGPQDGSWIAVPATPGAIGSTTYIVNISQDRMVRINVGGSEWVVQQSYPASRVNDQITWKTIASPPTGSLTLLPNTNIEYDFMVSQQTDGTLTGTASQGISTIPGVASIPTSSFSIVMSRI